MLRYLIWILTGGYLLIIGLWSTAATPIVLVLAGLATVLATVPGPVWALAAAVAWLKHRPTPTATA